MPSVQYTALRNVASGHTAGTLYSIDFEIHQGRVPSWRDDKSAENTLDGTPDTVFYSGLNVYQVVTEAIQTNVIAWDYWQEFLESVRRYETFIYDPEGTAASPSGKEVTGYLDSLPQYTEYGSIYASISFTVVKF